MPVPVPLSGNFLRGTTVPVPVPLSGNFLHVLRGRGLGMGEAR